MLRVIGQPNCGQCMIVKKLLTSKKVEFNYENLNDLENKEEEIEKAKQNGVFTLPLILDEDKYLTMNQLVEKIKTI